jgi:aspartyl-tRNA(Asn)/glutamyl-tRNA(Gln) amidotransferase subunit A
MDDKKLLNLSAVATSRLIRKGDIRVRDVLDHYLRQYQTYEKSINAFIDFQPERYLTAADVLQKRITLNEPLGVLAGIPVALKDNICTKDVRTTCGSKMLKDFIPPYSAHVVELLGKSGVLITGKCNMDEFAMGNTSETSAFGPIKNPWNLAYTPGGSSGGSAAAVAAGIIPLSLGSDTGGSVRQPAACCGISGLKPTYGTVSRYGLVAYASSLDQIGPMAVYIEDIAALFDTIKIHDRRDSTQINGLKADHLTHLEEFMHQKSEMSLPLKNKKIAVLKDSDNRAVQEEVRLAIHSLIDQLTKMGAYCEIVNNPTSEYAVPAYYIIACAEASSNLARYDGIKYTQRSAQAKDLAEIYFKTRTEYFGTEVIRRILLGSFVLSSGYFDAYYRTALKVRTLIQDDFNRIFTQYDAIISPVSLSTAPALGESLQDPLAMYLNDQFTVSANLTGMPALTFPCGFDRKGLPIGAQLLGKPFDEDFLIVIAALFQQRTGFHKKEPFQQNYRRDLDETI